MYSNNIVLFVDSCMVDTMMNEYVIVLFGYLIDLLANGSTYITIK